VVVSKRVCEHFAQTRAELDEIVRREQITTFAVLSRSRCSGGLRTFCKPVVASILAIRLRRYSLDGEQPAAGHERPHACTLQKDGTYSVRGPRLPRRRGPRPRKLIVIGDVARYSGW